MNTEVVQRSDNRQHSENKKKRSLGKSLLRIAMIVATGYVAILATLAVNETSLVYPGSKYPAEARTSSTATQFRLRRSVHGELPKVGNAGTAPIGLFPPTLRHWADLLHN